MHVCATADGRDCICHPDTCCWSHTPHHIAGVLLGHTPDWLSASQGGNASKSPLRHSSGSIGRWVDPIAWTQHDVGWDGKWVKICAGSTNSKRGHHTYTRESVWKVRAALFVNGRPVTDPSTLKVITTL